MLIEVDADACIGALDLALETAEKEGAAYVLAQDPDADRFSAAQRRLGNFASMVCSSIL